MTRDRTCISTVLPWPLALRYSVMAALALLAAWAVYGPDKACTLLIAARTTHARSQIPIWGMFRFLQDPTLEL